MRIRTPTQAQAQEQAQAQVDANAAGAVKKAEAKASADDTRSDARLRQRLIQATQQRLEDSVAFWKGAAHAAMALAACMTAAGLCLAYLYRTLALRHAQQKRKAGGKAD